MNKRSLALLLLTVFILGIIATLVTQQVIARIPEDNTPQIKLQNG